MSTLSEDVVRRWLLCYAWTGTDDEKARTVECIISQGNWRHLDAIADRYAGAQAQPGPEAFSRGMHDALSGLYECHSRPHIASCPDVTVSELHALAWLTGYIKVTFPQAWAQAIAEFQELERREGQATS
jgi:hypothetical protein